MAAMASNANHQLLSFLKVVFDTFFLLNARKIRKFQNKFANQHKLYSQTVVLRQYNISAIRQLHGAIKFAIKELNLSKLSINLIYCSLYNTLLNSDRLIG